MADAPGPAPTRLLMIDHAFHRVTDSSRFFAELLATRFAVARLYVLPDARLDLDWAVIAEHDIVVLWQLDFLAPLFLARGHRTVVIPMYDGSSALPQVHWSAAGAARFVNFSRTLHERTRLLGLDTRLAKFFPEPVAADRLPGFDRLRAFLWQRRPEQGINLALLDRLFGAQLHSVHVHAVPDNPALARHFAPPPQLGAAAVTVSEWFDDPADYRRLLDDCNVFICPRPAEGIGMAMLEAMARGMLVVANDRPVHNEYICNWVNGVLFNTTAIGEANFDNAARIARMGWHTVRDGRRQWLESTARLLDFIAGTPRYQPADPDLTARLDRDLLAAYRAGGEAYERLLLRLLPGLLRRDPAPEGSRPAPVARATPRRVPVAVVPLRSPDDSVIRLTFANGAARALLETGWSWDEDFGVWIEGRRATLCFAAEIGFPVAALAIRARALAPGPASDATVLRLSVNEIAARHGVALPGGQVTEAIYQIAPPTALPATAWSVEFTCDQTHASPDDRRQLSAAILALDITFLPHPIVAPVPAEPATALAAPRSAPAVARRARAARTGAPNGRGAAAAGPTAARPVPGRPGGA